MKSDHDPTGMLPRAFVCATCEVRVQETIYGSGFQNCGMVQATTAKWLCATCMQKVLEFVEALKIGNR